jgi:hypothetical protein
MKKSVLMKIIMFAITIIMMVGFAIGLNSCDGVFNNNSENNSSDCKHKDPSKIVILKGKEATCQEAGLTERKKCTLCNTVFVPGTIIPKLDCVEGDWIIDKEATKTEDGAKHTECTLCGKIIKKEIITLSSKGLEFAFNDDGVSYSVKGIGTCTDTELIIPSVYNGLPVTRIADAAFADCMSFSRIIIPNSVTDIGGYAFQCCESLTSINIPNSVTNIGEGALGYCTSLENIEVSDNHKYYSSIDGNLYNKDGTTLIQFAIGKRNKSFVVPNTVTTVGYTSFCGSKYLESITISNSVSNIERAAFHRCIALKNAIIDAIAIGEDAFYDCDSLISVVFGNSVVDIGSSAFNSCGMLTNITISDSVINIAPRAFASCVSLTNVVIGKSVANIGAGAFCYSPLTSIEVKENNEHYKLIDGNLYTADGKTLIQYIISNQNESFTIPKSVTSIGSHAFAYCTSLKTVIIPDSVTTIGSGAFLGCVSLTNVTIPGSVTSIGDYAFSHCSSLASINIPDSVTSIGRCAFQLCEVLTSIIIPESVTSIGDWTFNGCYSVKIYCEATLKPIGWGQYWHQSSGYIVWNYRGN